MSGETADPLMFEGLIGVSIAMTESGAYASLFRENGKPKSLAELREIPWALAFIDRELEDRANWRRDRERARP